MIRLIKLLVSLVVLAGFVYFAVAVPLGDKTLWEHTKAIAGSKEAQHLVDGVKRAVGAGSGSGSGSASASPKASDHGKVSHADQRRLRRVIRGELARGGGKH